MDNIYIQESYVNETQNLWCGESDVYESFTNNKGELFKHLQKEYGRCTSKVYTDISDKKSMQIGWIFEKRVKYEDSNEYFTQYVWVTLHKSKPVKSIKYNYFELN